VIRSGPSPWTCPWQLSRQVLDCILIVDDLARESDTGVQLARCGLPGEIKPHKPRRTGNDRCSGLQYEKSQR
jgi:hypothetical protein